MPRKAIDSRIPAMIRNGIQEKKRSFFVVVGDHAKDVIVNLHYIMSSVDVKQNKSVLWAYKKELLGFSSHRRKREAKIKKEVKRGIRDPNTEDAFELFVGLQDIRYVYYKETENILGNTYGMCILQDFEALTPNLLARTVETVEGGGLVVLLLKGMKSLKQLYTLSMDIHSRYRTEAHDDVVGRFNERFILSLGSCESCLVIDDELNVLPISGGKNIQPLPPVEHEEQALPKKAELKAIKEKLADTKPVGPLLQLSRTVDQAKAVLTFIDTIAEKSLRSTVTLTAARGRGKSAALGVAVASAVAHGYSNIFITSPSPENLKTFFEFVFKGFDALGYMDHVDYTILQSTNPAFNKAVVRVNIHHSHRQIIQYIQPNEASVLGQAELLVIDEAAAIPLPLVRKLMGPYLVFMASTINGYEGTGRSLSLKLIQQLREQSRGGAKPADSTELDRSTGKAANPDKPSTSGRSLREITLTEPIRYAPGDGVEKWLNKLLCLDATLPRSNMNTQGTPHPSRCELLAVNRDTLFSFHPVSEKFLQQMMALYVASHYKNSPNDLQLMSDAPAHQLFVLVPPIDENATKLPDPLVVIQVALEGRISRQSILNSLSRGQRSGGDLIPWLVSQQFQDANFPSLSGARIVRIATNPDYASMGYGAKAIDLLVDFYEGKFANLSEEVGEGDNGGADASRDEIVRVTDAELENSSLQDDNIRVRDIRSMPPLFSKLSERRPEPLDYIGVSYGLTAQLHKFWKRAQFCPIYMRQTPNELTGEHTCVMLRTLANGSSDNTWLGEFAGDFHKRFLTLLSYQFRTFPSILSLSLDETAESKSATTKRPVLTRTDLDAIFTPFDLKRLDSYANNLLDYHVILDLIPAIATLYFTGRFGSKVHLSGIQQSILLGVGLQRKSFDDMERELSVAANQLMAMFIKISRKVSTFFRSVLEQAVAETMPAADAGVSAREISGAHDDDDAEADTAAAAGGDAGANPDEKFQPVQVSLHEELAEGAKEVNTGLREKQKALIDALPLDRYEINTTGPAWEDAEKQVKNSLAKNGIDKTPTVSVKSTKQPKRKAGESAREIYEKEIGSVEQKKIKRGTEGGGGKSSGSKKSGASKKKKN